MQVPYGMVTANNPDGSAYLRPMTEAEWGRSGYGGPAAPPAGGPSGPPAEIGKPPALMPTGDGPQFMDGGGDNIYRDQNGVYRNRRPAQGGGGASPGAYTPTRYAPQTGGTPSGYSGGGGGGGGGGQYSGSTAMMAGGESFGGGGMPTLGGSTGALRTQFTQPLDASIWNTPITGGSTTASAGQAGGYASALANLNPSAGQAERTLYDRYSALLQDPTMGMNNPASQFALQRAQQAAQRQLAAGRMRNSGRALEELSGVTTGTLMQQFGNLANIYGQGAEAERSRYATEAGLGLDAQKLKLAGLQGAGDLAVRSGGLYSASDDAALRARALDLQRAQGNIMTPYQQQVTDIRAEALKQANANPSGYGTFSPSLSQQYLNLTGTPLTLTANQLGGNQFANSFGQILPAPTRYWT